MNRKECLQLMMQYFQIDSCINHLKNPDFELKSHTFYYRDTFKDVEELRILRVSSKNKQDDIVFDVYYVSQKFDGLFHGYFRIKTETEQAELLFENISKVATDLGHYFYYVYKNSEILKIYLISGNFQNALEHGKNRNYDIAFQKVNQATWDEIAKHSVQALRSNLLQRVFMEKYINNFIELNSKSGEKVKMFLINILSKKYEGHICLIPNKSDIHIENYILITTNSVTHSTIPNAPIYGLLDYIVKENSILFIKFEFDFEGGGYIGKSIG